MDVKYTTDRTTQILIALLKAHGIHNVIASPGTTNAIFVASIQNDSFFNIISSVDERSAAYMACGMAASTKEPVVITCTEATASRNYFPGLTEAYYRKLPILAITGLHSPYNVGNLCTQAIDRSSAPKDTIKYSTTVCRCETKEDEWHVNLEINKAILELSRNGGGPVHINLQVAPRWDFFSESIPETRVIRRISFTDEIPPLPSGKIAIVIGSHADFSRQETDIIDKFCNNHNAVVFSDLISGYHGQYSINAGILVAQRNYKASCLSADLVIHLGEIGWTSAKSKQTWRVSLDGEIRDTYHNLTYLFDMDICSFFSRYLDINVAENTYYEQAKQDVAEVINEIKDLPLSNAWLANRIHSEFPQNSIVHFGILNSFRVWNHFAFHDTIKTSCNFGGFGIDGGISTMIGSSLVNPNILHFGVFGDLAFFYDMNSLGNRHIGNNIRILLINNGKGNEFRNCIHPAYKLGEMADDYIAAAGHYGNKSSLLVSHYATDLGYKYITASTKEEVENHLNEFLSPDITDEPIIFEVFTNGEDESEALNIIGNLKADPNSSIIDSVKKNVRSIIGDSGIVAIKTLLKK